MYKILIYLLLCTVFSSCKNNSRKILNGKEISITNPIKSRDTLLNSRVYEFIKSNIHTTIKTTGIIFGRYEFKIETLCLNDSAVDETPKFNPGIIKQTLFFYFDNRLIKKINSPALLIVRNLRNKKNVKILSEVIYEISCINGRYGSIFTLEGTGGCNSCDELRAMYSIEGNLLFCFYGSTTETHISKADPDSVFQKFGITDKSIERKVNLNTVKYFY